MFETLAFAAESAFDHLADAAGEGEGDVDQEHDGGQHNIGKGTVYVNPMNMTSTRELTAQHLVDPRTLMREDFTPGLFWKFNGFVFIISAACFSLPISSACGPEAQMPSGRWPEGHSLFWVSMFPAVLLMYLPVPIFAFLLGDSYHTVEEDENHESYRRGDHGERDNSYIKRLVLEAAALCGVTSTITIMNCVLSSRFVTGFPVAFSAFTCGFPGYFLTFAGSWPLLKLHGVEDPKLAMKKVFVICFLVLNNALLYSLLAAIIKRFPAHVTIVALFFPAIKVVGRFTLKLVCRHDFDRILPVSWYLDTMNSVFPSLILPSAVNAWTLLMIIILDIIGALFSLRQMWIPVLRSTLAEANLETQRQEHSDANNQLATAKLAVKAAKEAVQRATAANFNALLEAEEALSRALNDLDAAEQQVVQESSDVAHAKTREEHAIQQLKDSLADMYGPKLMQTEIDILLFISSQTLEIMCPMWCLGIELWLYFGPMTNAVPPISNMPMDEFVFSSVAKACIALCEVGTCLVAGYLINSTSELDFGTLFLWSLDHYWEALVICSAAFVVWCYAMTMPHYNLNLDGVLAFFLDDKFDVINFVNEPQNCPHIVDSSLGGGL